METPRIFLIRRNTRLNWYATDKETNEVVPEVSDIPDATDALLILRRLHPDCVMEGDIQL